MLPTTIVVLSVLLLVARLYYVLHVTGRRQRRRSAASPLSALIVLGSGGHTAEMLNLLGALDARRYGPRSYVAAATDSMSLARAETAERARADDKENSGAAAGGIGHEAKYFQIYRSREVGQSYATSVVSTLVALAHAMWLVVRIRPDVVFANGPGTCLPVCIAAFLLKVFGLKHSIIIFIESVARVQKLSLTGTILFRLGIADQFYVQWPQLSQKYAGTLYVGRLM